MTAPKQKVREWTVARDLKTCVAADSECFGGLEWNHRESCGHGGRGRKAPAVTTADGVMLCSSHNARLESDAAFRDYGLSMGWKILRNRGARQSHEIPYFDATTATYYLPVAAQFDGPIRIAIPTVEARRLLFLAGNLRESVA